MDTERDGTTEEWHRGYCAGMRRAGLILGSQTHALQQAADVITLGADAHEESLEAKLAELREEAAERPAGPERLRAGLVLACQDVARLKMEAHRDASGEDFDEEKMVRLGGADEMREIMMRVDDGEGPAG